MRTLLWVLGGLVLGGIVHIVVVLLLPSLSGGALWARIVALDALNRPVVLTAPAAGEANPLHLDPELVYAVCRIDLRHGPGVVAGTLPQSFWSVAVYNRLGVVTYSTTGRDSAGQAIDVGIFNSVQTRLLAEQKIDVAEGLLIVSADQDDVFVVVRLEPPQPVMRARYAEELKRLTCGNIPS